MARKKETISEVIHSNIVNRMDGMSFEEMMLWMEAIKKENPKYSNFVFFESSASNYEQYYLDIHGIREETDAEQKERLKKKANQQKMQRELDKLKADEDFAQYLTLKARFESNHE